ncbi:MAG: protein kinase [Pseudomonadota bacterium]
MAKLPSIPGFAIEKRIGRGGMGTVYRARQTSLGREVAIKIMDPSLVGQSERALERFKREAATAASLHHPNIITVHQTGEYSGHCYMAMDFVTGGSLRDLLKPGPLDHRETLKIALGVAAGLASAHASGFVHRDIKPENILIGGEGQPVITDFGVVKLTYSYADQQERTTFGSPAYMSPEQHQASADLDGRADLYSLGVVLFEMLEGQVPFQGESRREIGLKHLHNPVPELSERNAPFQRIVRRLLAKTPEMRYPSVADLIKSLRLLRTELFPGATTGSHPAQPVRAARRKVAREGERRRGGRRAVAALVGLLALWVAGLVLLPGLRLAQLPLEFEALLGSATEKRRIADRLEEQGNLKRSRFWLARAAAGGNPGASYELGLQLRLEDEAQAVDAFLVELATADSWNRPARLMLAETLCNGRDLEDCGRAIRTLEELASRTNDQRAMQTLGEIHRSRLQPPDFAVAASWFERVLEVEGQVIPSSTEATEAMLALAELHARGQGMPRDPQQSVRLLALAAQSPVARDANIDRARRECEVLEDPPTACSAIDAAGRSR